MAEHHSAPTIPEGANGDAGNSGKIRAGHLLVKHKDSRRPSSWREVRLRCKYLTVTRRLTDL
jgi:NIMA-interacting peptidyl-prolyl cis-trans isomerase 1